MQLGSSLPLSVRQSVASTSKNPYQETTEKIPNLNSSFKVFNKRVRRALRNICCWLPPKYNNTSKPKNDHTLYFSKVTTPNKKLNREIVESKRIVESKSYDSIEDLYIQYTGSIGSIESIESTKSTESVKYIPMESESL